MRIETAGHVAEVRMVRAAKHTGRLADVVALNDAIDELRGPPACASSSSPATAELCAGLDFQSFRRLNSGAAG